MDLLNQTKKLCQEHNIRPSRSKGQNFLISEGIYNKIITESDPRYSDEVLEVGPGPGFMTVELAARVKQVVAVELDDKLAVVLRSRLKGSGIKNVEVLNRDILNMELPPRSFSSDYKVVANLPYNITSVFLRKFLTDPSRPGLMVLLLQKEVAERIVARPPNMSLLALSVQYYTEPFFVKKVSAGSFWPRPRVDSAIVKLKTRSRFPCPSSEENIFFRLIRLGFSSKRKMLKNNLSSGLDLPSSRVEEKLEQTGLHPKIRAQELYLKDWANLTKIFKNNIYEKKD